MEPHTDNRIAMIRSLLQSENRGMSISDIASRLGMKRNIVSSDLSYLLRLGQVEMEAIGTSKVFFAATKIPISGILNYSSDMILVIDNDRQVVEANTPLLAMTGLKRDEIISCTLDACPGPLFSTLAGLPPEAKGTHDIAVWLPVLDDPRAIRHFRVKPVPIVFEDMAHGTMITIEDTTEAVRYRDALRMSEERYKAIVEDMHDLIFRFLPNGILTYTNRAFSGVFGQHDTDHRGENVYSLFSGDDRVSFLELVRSARGETPVVTGMHALKTPGGVRQYSLSIRAISGESGKIVEYQGLGRDISAELEAQDQVLHHASEKEFLCRVSQQFLETRGETEIYEQLAENIGRCIPGSVIMVFSYDEKAGAMRAELIRDENGSDLLATIFGDECLTFSLPQSIIADLPGYEALIRGGITPIETGSLIPLIGDAAIQRIREVIGMRSVAATMMVWEGTMVGAVAICLPEGPLLENQPMAETVIHIAALALQRQYTRESLRKSDTRFRTVTEVTPLPVSIISPDGHYISLNSSFTDLFGYTLEDIPDGRRWFLQAFPDIRQMQRARELWLQDLRKSEPGEIRSRRFPVRCKNGSIRSILFHPVTLPDGCQLVVYEDITGREEADRVRNLLAEIVRTSHDAIIGMTTTGRIQTWNPGAERVYGYPAEEVVGKDIALLFPPRLLAEKDRILSLAQSGKFIPELETRRVRKDGTEIDVSVTISPISDRDGNTIGISTIVKDITARKAAERFRELESRYRSLVDAINVGVYRSTADPGGRFVWGNSSLVRILGYPSFDDMAGIPVADHFLHFNGRQELLDELRQSGFVKNRELLLQKKDGSTVHVLVTALATFAPDGEIAFINGIVEDVTESRILARKLASLGEQAPESGPSPR